MQTTEVKIFQNVLVATSFETTCIFLMRWCAYYANSLGERQNER